ncbi:MAG TPA: glycosyltransferase family 39 protein [Planctomycetaceae bacterium]|nr:glycosyltransferase family 39 protein [Planctomycetaceae bacterium]
MISRARIAWLVLVACFGLAAAAGVVLARTPFAAIRGYLDARAGDGSADRYTPALHLRLQVAFAVCGLAAGGAAVGLAVGRKRLVGVLGPAWRGGVTDGVRLLRRWRAAGRRMGLAVLAVTLLGGVLRAAYLNQPMRFDESYTYLAYASQPWYVALSRYDAPNNHVFHSLLVVATTRLFGEAPWAIRLPACLAGVLVVPATMLLARRVANRGAALLAGLIVATSSPLIEYSTNARGYMLVCLATLVAWLAAIELARRPNRAAAAVLAASIVAGCWSVPIMLYAASMLVVWMLAQRGTPVGAVPAAAGTLVVYAPVLIVEGPGALLASGMSAGMSWRAWISGASGWTRETGALLLRDVPWPAVIAAVLAMGVAVGDAERAVRRRWWTAALSILVPVGIVAAQRVVPPGRVWLFLLPLAAVLVGTGLSRLLGRLHNAGVRRMGLVAAGVLLAAWPLVNLVRNDSIQSSVETGALPDAEPIVADLGGLLREGEFVLTVSPSSAPLVYYARRRGLDVRHFDRPGPADLPSRGGVVVVHRHQPQTPDTVLQELGFDPASVAGRVVLLKEYPSARVYRIVGHSQ